jgi:acyl carrier protein
MMTIESKVLDAIKNACKKNDAQIINATSWVELDFDSLQTIELIMQMEDEFKIVIEDDDAELLKNYNDLIAFIKEKTK